MWTSIVSSILLVIACVDAAPSEVNGSFLPTPIQYSFSKFKSNVHRILEGERIRKKRQLLDSDTLDHKLILGTATSVDLPYLSDYNLTFWTSVNERHKNQVLIGTTGGHILLFELADNNDKEARTVAIAEVEDIAIKAKAFTYYDEQWFAVLHYSNTGQEYYIRMYQRIQRGLEKKQKIDLLGFSDMELVQMKGIYYLVVATYSTTTGQGLSYQASVKLYHWAQTQFDEIASRMSFGARSVVCWSFDGSLYIALAQENNDDLNYEVGSPIYFYNSKEENKLVLWQKLATFGPRKIQYFFVAGNHYLVVIGRKDAVIYWWSSGQFLEWQSLMGTADASDVSVLALGDGEVAIVIALKEVALFYTLDASGMYVITYEMTLRGSGLHSLQFMFSGQAYFALALFSESQRHSIQKLTLSSHYMPTVESLDPLNQCLSTTKDSLKKRAEELDFIGKELSRVWLKGSNQNVTSNVVIKGSIKSNQQSKVRDLVIVTHTVVPDASMSRVISSLVAMTDKVQDVQNNFTGVVLKSTRQDIRGPKYFEDTVYVPSLTIGTTKNDVSINGVRISRLQNYGLRKLGNQVFSKDTSFANIYGETASVSSLNGISTEDFLLRHGKQIVSGNLDFTSASAGTIATRTVNSIPVETIITESSPQYIKEMKTFTFLKSNSINVKGETNEVDLSGVVGRISTVDDFNEFTGQLTFVNPLSVNGDIFLTGKIDKLVDISRLVSQSVNPHSQQDLTGQYTFIGKPTVTGDVLVGGSINKVSVDNLLTTSSNQELYADVSFAGSLTMARDLEVEMVNRVDLSETAVRKESPYQFITGRKTFAKDITVDFVDMTEYITLDGVDPSLLVQDIVQHEQGLVSQNQTVLKDVDVLGNVTLHDTNGFEILNVQSWAWLKSVEQNITVPVTANVLHFKRDLDVGKMDGLDLESDVVHSFSDEVIESSKTFQFETVFKSLKTTDGTINGMNLKSFEIELENYRNGTVQGTKEIGSLELHGDLKITKLNEFPFAIIHPSAFQAIQGPVDFPAELTTIQGDANVDSISFSTINGKDLQSYFFNAVSKTHRQRSIFNKSFKNLEALNLTMFPKSKIGGISLQEMHQRVVTLNTPQLVTAPKSFASSLNFKKIISVGSLNGLDLSNYLNEVILVDETSVINNKKFLRMVQAQSAFVRGAINGIKISDLAENVFYKSDNNVVNEPFIFEGDVDIEDFYAPVLDGVEWKDLVFLDRNEDLETGWILSKTDAEQDIFITGLVNGCDLSQIASSLYTNKASQVINKNVNVHTILVIGNLIVRNKINSIPLGALQNFITASGEQNITSNVVIDAKLIVDKLQMSNTANFDLSFIVKDAVRHSISQEVTGEKTFKGKVDIAVLSGGDIFAAKVNGVDIEDLELTTVWKNGHQEISGEKVFQSLSMDAAVVNGFINGLKLPEDVVRADVSEHITSPTYFMSDLFIPMELIVHGHIDGVNINELILQRVTLSTDQNITAALTFNDDFVIYDDLTIDGTVNEIVLDLIAKVKSVQPLQGYKIFIDFYVSGPVAASLVNGYNLIQLSSSILRYNQDDYVNGLQVFEKPIRAQNSLYAEWINSIPFRHITEGFISMMSGLKSVLGFLKDLSSNLQKTLNIQMAAVQEKASKFAYFTLFQEINMGPTSRILHGYSLEQSDSQFSNSLVMWTTKKQCVFMEKCCHLEFSHWLRVRKNGVVMADRAAESGRYYPIIDPSPVIGGHDFFIWTNATDVQFEWCGQKKTRMTFASNNDGGFYQRQGFSDSEDAAVLSDVRSFRKAHLYAVAAFYLDSKHKEYGNTVVYEYDEKHHWTERQILPSFGVLSMDIITYTRGYKEEILLALGTGMNTEPLSYSTVYKWNNIDRAFDFLQNIPSRYVTSTLWVRKGRDLLLSLAGVDYWPDKSTDCSELATGGQIDIYEYKEHLKWIQSIPVGGVVSLVSFYLDGDTYLAAGSTQYQTIYIFEWRGYEGFVEIQSISTEVRHLNIYSIGDDIYMTVASMSGPSKILKMVRSGKQHKAEKEFKQIHPDIQDEAPLELKDVKGCEP